MRELSTSVLDDSFLFWRFRKGQESKSGYSSYMSFFNLSQPIGISVIWFYIIFNYAFTKSNSFRFIRSG